jgi:hypothetical protein
MMVYKAKPREAEAVAGLYPSKTVCTKAVTNLAFRF